MKTLKDIAQLLEGEQGKVFIMDAEGEIRLVLMGMQEYQSIKGQVMAQPQAPQPEQQVDPEAVNRRILEAQLAEQTRGADPSVWAEEAVATKGSPFTAPPREKGDPFGGARRNPHPAGPAPSVSSEPKHDLREEVIDPSFNFDSEDI